MDTVPVGEIEKNSACQQGGDCSLSGTPAKAQLEHHGQDKDQENRGKGQKKGRKVTVVTLRGVHFCGRGSIAHPILPVSTDHDLHIDDVQHQADDKASDTDRGACIQSSTVILAGDDIGRVGRTGNQVTNQRITADHDHSPNLTGKISGFQDREG